MEEKIIIESEKVNFKTTMLWAIIIAIIFGAICWFVFSEAVFGYSEAIEHWNVYHDDYMHNKYDWCSCENFSTATSYAAVYGGGNIAFWAISVGSAFLIITCTGLFCLIHSKTEIIVTEKRVYGKTALGKRVDLPMDSISAVSTAWFNGISVATSSGKISFLLIKNSKEIHTAISQLLIDRQEKKNNQPIVNATQNTSGADDLIKYKQLLDSGVITQEEFDLKKKQILGL